MISLKNDIWHRGDLIKGTNTGPYFFLVVGDNNIIIHYKNIEPSVHSIDILYSPYMYTDIFRELEVQRVKT